MFESNQNSYNLDKSQIPYLRVNDKLLDYDYTKRIFELLEHNAPELLNRFGSLIIEYAKRIQKKEERLEYLENETTILASKVASNKKRLKISLDEIPPEPKTEWHNSILSIGLSFLLFIGVLSFLQLEIEDIPKQPLISILALAASICINLAEKKSIENFVYHYVKNDNNSKIDANNLGKYLFQSPILVAILIVISETGLAASGLQAINIVNSDNWLLQMSIFMGAALAALVNVSLAWSEGKDRAEWEIKHQEEKKTRIRENIRYIVEYESDEKLLKKLNRQISRIRKELNIEKREAVKEYVRWERDLKTYLGINQFSSINKSSDLEFINNLEVKND
jgi:hypothetical protein